MCFTSHSRTVAECSERIRGHGFDHWIGSKILFWKVALDRKPTINYQIVHRILVITLAVVTERTVFDIPKYVKRLVPVVCRV